MPPRLILFLTRLGFPLTKKWVLDIARFESRNLGHNFIGTEHVVCALARLPDSRIKEIFARRGLTVESIRKGVVDECALGPHQHSRAFRPLTPRLRKVLMVADGLGREAKQLSVPQRLFVAIITEGLGVGMRVLGKLGLDRAQLRHAFPETAIEPRVTVQAFKPGESVWFIHPAYGVGQAAAFIRDHGNGAYIFGGHTGSHYTGHGESAGEKLRQIQDLGYLWWPYARSHGIAPAGWLPPEKDADGDSIVKRIKNGEL